MRLRLQLILALVCALLAGPAFAQESLDLLGVDNGAVVSGGGGSTSSFVVYSNYQPNTSTDTIGFAVTNAQPGDILILEGVGGGFSAPTFTANGSGGAMTQLGSDAWSGVGITNWTFWKALTAGDISNHTIAGTGLDTAGNVSMAIFRGGTTVVWKGFSQSSPNGSQAATLVMAGYAQTQGTAVNMECSRVNTGTSYTVTIPSPFITPADQQNSGSGIGVTGFYTCDVFHSASNLSATTYTFSGYATTGGGAGQAGTLLEIH